MKLVPINTKFVVMSQRHPCAYFALYRELKENSLLFGVYSLYYNQNAIFSPVHIRFNMPFVTIGSRYEPGGKDNAFGDAYRYRT